MDDTATNSSVRMESEFRRKKTKKNKAKVHNIMNPKGASPSQDENNTNNNGSQENKPKMPTIFYDPIVTNSTKAVDIMSLVAPIPTEDGIWKPIPVEIDGQGREKFDYGEPLVEIYAVRIGDMGANKYRKIHGKIVLGCRYRNISLLNIDQENALTVESQDSLPLNGPDVAPLGSEPFTIAVDLKEDGEEFCRKLIYWTGKRSFHYDTWFNETVIGEKSSVNVIYTVFEAAWLAEVHLKLTKLVSGASMVRIEGSITVYFDDMQYLRTVVLSKSRDECFTIRLLENIPLSRSLFCCRAGSSIVVKIDLKDSDNNESLVQGSLLFPPTYYGDTEGTLSGQGGDMQVNVVWMDFAEHPKTRAACWNPSAFEKVSLFD